MTRRKIQYFLPDAQDLVDPSFDFKRETRNPDRVRQRDDTYAHEVLEDRAFEGILISKAIVDGLGGGGQARYTQAQRARLLREGARDFFRVKGHAWGKLQFLGDCGAFSYVKEEVPPYTVDEMAAFYTSCGFDLGISVDHVILEYNASWDAKIFGRDGVPKAVKARQEITLELAKSFLAATKAAGDKYEPIGVAQGWSPTSFARSVGALQKMGYGYIALGGLVPMKTPDILATLDAVSEVRKPATRLHLLGVTRVEHIPAFARYGVASFDSTSPLRQAFKDDTDNYYTLDRTYPAVRVPQVQGNPKLLKQIRSGEVDHDRARDLERKCLKALAEHESGERKLPSVITALHAYEELHSPGTDRRDQYREVLEAAPWRTCPCSICKEIGYHVILFRGAERNRRRGFHNVGVFYLRLQREAAKGVQAATPATRGRSEQLHLMA